MEDPKFVDARTGKIVTVGVPVIIRGRIIWPDGSNDDEEFDDSYGLEAVSDPGIFSVQVRLRALAGERAIWDTRLPIRYLHPAFAFERVAFIPT